MFPVGNSRLHPAVIGIHFSAARNFAICNLLFGELPFLPRLSLRPLRPLREARVRLCCRNTIGKAYGPNRKHVLELSESMMVGRVLRHGRGYFRREHSIKRRLV